MLPMTKIQARIFAAKHASGAFSYFNSRHKCNKTVAYYRGPSPLYIEKDATEIFDKVYQEEQSILNEKHRAAEVALETKRTAFKDLVGKMNWGQLDLLQSFTVQMLTAMKRQKDNQYDTNTSVQRTSNTRT